jgi:hypothetical protein
MLAEIFFLQLEATMRANSGVCALRLDYCARPKEAPHRIAERPPGEFAVARALNLRIGF